MANLFSENPIVEIVAVPGRDGTDIPIDDRLSDTSENPVQNKVVKQAIDNAVSATEDYATQAVEQAYEQLDEAKQDVLDDSGAGQNIKTINGESILGTGNLEVGSQIDVDDALNPTSENPVQNRTLYQAFNELNNDVISEVSRLANRVYGYTHEAIVTDDLENDYNLIINGGYQRLYNPPIDWNTEYASYYYLDDTIYRLNASPTWDWNVEYYKRYTPNNDLANVSAVGMLAVLNHGVYTAVPTQPADWEVNYDKYFYLTSEGYIFNEDSTWNPNRSYYSYSGDVVRTQENRLFINGEESNGYTFRGANSQNGIELVKIWYFNDATLNLIKPDFDVSKIIRKTGMGTINVYDDFYNYADFVEYDGSLNGAVVGIKKQKNNSNANFTDTVFSAQLNEYESNCENMPADTGPHNLTMLKRIRFPELKSIGVGSNNLSGFTGCTNLIEMYFPKLESIASMITTYPPRAPFYHVDTVTIPESVISIGKWAFVGNKKVILNCKNATDIKDDAFNPNEPPTEYEMCSDWGASINIATAAKNWIHRKFTDLITTDGALRNVGFVERLNNDGNADYDSINDTYIPNTTGTGAYNTAKYLTIPSTRFAALSQSEIDIAFNKGWELRGA